MDQNLLNTMDKNFIDFKSSENIEPIKDLILKEIKFFFKKNNDFENDIKLHLNEKEIVQKIYQIIEIFSSKPLSKIDEISNELEIENVDLIKSLFVVVRSIKLFQELIIKKGQGSKYWINIILPLLKSKSVQNFIEKKTVFPFRVGLFPGVSCMFECSFCGRNYDAVYNRDYAQKGLDVFKKIIDESPAEDKSRFFLSGGLEPLTNPYLSSIIDYLKFKNFKASLYTNGYMLTEKYLKKNPSIFSLDSLRISFYGVNDQETLSVTKKKNAFKIVTNNIVNYLKLKDELNSKTSFGLNFVILKNRSADVLELFKLVSDLNKSVGNKKNNFNFITLREDFRILGDRMDNDEKDELIKNIEILEQMKKDDEYLNNIHIDYGFALEPLKNGFNGNKLESNFASFDDLKILALPQGRVVVDLYGDVYLFGEAGFLDRPGVKKYILGNLFKDDSLSQVIENFIKNPHKIDFQEGDRDFLDAWDHVAVKLSQQYIDYKYAGINSNEGIINIEKINELLDSNHNVHFSS